MHLPADAVLILIDFQRGPEDPTYDDRNNPDAEATAAELVAVWRDAGRPIVHVRHASTESDSALRPDELGFEWIDGLEPQDGEYTVEKNVNGAFIGTPLDGWLRDNDYDTLVICGLKTDHCVSTTVRMAENRDYDVYLVADAFATFEHTTPAGDAIDAETNHQVALAHLDGEFATIVESVAVIDGVRSIQ